MANLDAIRIRHPRLHNKFAALPNPFLVIGVATKGKITLVAGTVTSLLDPTKSYSGKPFYFAPTKNLPCGHPIQWALRFGADTDIPDGRYFLSVSGMGLGEDSKPVTLNTQTVDEFAVVTKNHYGPEISYPSPDQDITADIDLFNAYGTDDASVSSAQLGTQSAYNIFYDAGSQTWFASFPPITGTGELLLTITDANGGTDSEYVTVDTNC